MRQQVLLIEDDDALRMSLTQALSLEGISVIQANGLDQARRTIRANFAGVILSDMRMPNKSGFDVLEYVKTVDTDLPVVFLTGEADVPMALKAMKEGAYDFLEKPCSTSMLQEVLKRALGYRKMVRQTRSLESALKNRDAAANNFPGTSQAVKDLRSALRKVSELRSHIHLHGDPGVGKKLAAFTIHTLSEDRDTCLALNFQHAPETAVQDLKVSSGLTDLILKNIDLASVDHQNQLHDLIIRRPNLRLIFSSTHPMPTLLEQGFHEDLASLRIIQVKVPTLMERKKDLPVLIETLMRLSARSLDVDTPDVPNEVYAEIMAKDWSGNLPEMREFAQSMVLGLNIRTQKAETLTLAQQMEAFEKLVLIETLKQNNGKAAEAAVTLGLPRKTLYDRLARFDIRPKDYKNA